MKTKREPQKQNGVQYPYMNAQGGKWKEHGTIMAGVLASLALLVLAAWWSRPERGIPVSMQVERATTTATLNSSATPTMKSPKQGPTATRTPFQPRQRTSTPTVSPTPTETPTPTVTDTPTLPPPPPPPPEPTDVPAPGGSAFVNGVSGHYQSLSLSCESRSAADWANFFGVSVSELEFQERLPRSDNPEKGFVGNPRDIAGMIPPNSYGVHAGPVAELLRSYGLPAEARRWMSFEDLQREISEGHPVIVWVVNNVISGRSVEYTASDGETTLVVSLEHTVMIVGYTESTVQVVDGGNTYSRTVSQFLNSWGALGNQAVVYGE